MLHDNYLCLVESKKQQIEIEAKFKRKTRKPRQLLSESGIFLCIAPPSLSRDRRIKMKKNQSICIKPEDLLYIRPVVNLINDEKAVKAVLSLNKYAMCQ